MPGGNTGFDTYSENTLKKYKLAHHLPAHQVSTRFTIIFQFHIYIYISKCPATEMDLATTVPLRATRSFTVPVEMYEHHPNLSPSTL